MKLRKLLTGVAAGAIAVATMSLAVSANVVFHKDFRTSQNLDEFIPSTNAGMDLIEPTFNENGMLLSKMSTNFLTYIIDFEKSGIEMDSDKYYLATFEGKSLDSSPQWSTMIIQLLGDGAGDLSDWQNIDSADGSVVVEDGKGYPINEDGTFKVSGLIKPEYITSERYDLISGICMWGCYNNNPFEYEVYYMTIEECDENGNPLGGATVVEVDNTADTAANDTAANDTAANDTAANNTATGQGDKAPATNDKGAANTGIADVATVVGIAVLATGAVIISRKRK